MKNNNFQLHLAAESGDCLRVREAISQGANILSNEMYAVRVCIRKKQFDTLKTIIKNSNNYREEIKLVCIEYNCLDKFERIIYSIDLIKSINNSIISNSFYGTFSSVQQKP